MYTICTDTIPIYQYMRIWPILFSTRTTNYTSINHKHMLEPKWLRMMRIDDDRVAPPHRHHPFITATFCPYSNSIWNHLKNYLLRTTHSANTKNTPDIASLGRASLTVTRRTTWLASVHCLSNSTTPALLHATATFCNAKFRHLLYLHTCPFCMPFAQVVLQSHPSNTRHGWERGTHANGCGKITL